MHIITTATPYQGYSQSFRERGKDTDGLLGIDYLTFSFMGYAANATKENIACVGIHWLNEAGDTIVSQS